MGQSPNSTKHVTDQFGPVRPKLHKPLPLYKLWSGTIRALDPEPVRSNTMAGNFYTPLYHGMGTPAVDDAPDRHAVL